jgi:ferredoxin
LRRALDTLPRLTGRLAKPRYFEYRESFCVHSRQGQTGCSRCIETCPASAIDSDSEAIHFDPHLCQGCGTCTLVCPTGAVRYRQPSADDLQEKLWQRVRTGDTHRPPALILCEPGSETAVRAAAGQSGERHTVVGVLPAIAALGMDTWLEFLAAGVPSVTLCPASDQSEPHLSTEIEQTRRLLSGLGHDPDRLVLREPGDLTGAADRPATERLSGIGISPGGRETDKRARVTAALAALMGDPPVVPDGILALPEGAPFGEVLVDQTRCTLCMACVRVCPRKALRGETVCDGGAPAALAFVENDCVQCGLCREACPESAVTLAPRFVFDPAVRTGVRMINESDMALCLNCGAPVASEAMTRRMEERLRAHPMFAGDALKRLRLCEACKAASAAGVRLTRFSGDGSGDERG